MHKATVEVYEERGGEWSARRKPVRRADARAFAGRVRLGALRIDLGCGAGRYTEDLGGPVIALDAARAMLDRCADAAPGALLVQGDIEALPFGDNVLHGGWANMSYLHIPGVQLPLALADLHRVLAVGAPVDIQMLAGGYEGSALPDDDVGGRFFSACEPDHLTDMLAGAGFRVEQTVLDGDLVRTNATRTRSLPDFVGAGMRLLVVGLNPSLFAADKGVAFARGSNRFWRAALAARIVSRDRDPRHALVVHAVGMTDLVKRATVGAAELSKDEYRHGLARVERLTRWLAPGALCMVGLTGWRASVDPGARVGLQETMLGGRPVYLMPSTSGANAHARLEELTDHLRAANELGQHAGRGPLRQVRA